MITIYVTDTNGESRTLELEENGSTSLMEVLVEENFDVPAICGGMAGCGTCHVGVLEGADKLDEIDDDEEFMLDTLPNLIEGSRLSCQLPLTKQLDGARIRVLTDGA